MDEQIRDFVAAMRHLAAKYDFGVYRDVFDQLVQGVRCKGILERIIIEKEIRTERENRQCHRARLA